MNTILSEEHRNLVNQVLAEELSVSPDRIQADGRLMDLDPDSLDYVNLSMRLEETFGVDVPDERWEKVETVNDVYELVSELLKHQE